tara:strand:- start:370 stop:531 length:162 start_codon:yes stop_codon:yes gene_type:complete
LLQRSRKRLKKDKRVYSVFMEDNKLRVGAVCAADVFDSKDLEMHGYIETYDLF